MTRGWIEEIYHAGVDAVIALVEEMLEIIDRYQDALMEAMVRLRQLESAPGAEEEDDTG